MLEIVPNVWLVQVSGGWNTYLVRDAESLTLVDAGPAGSGAELAEAVRSIGARPEDVDALVLTHFHTDHVGGAAEVRAWGARVHAHRADAPFVRGDVPGPEPVLQDWERAIMASLPPIPPPAPCPVDVELEGGERLDVGGGAQVIAAPGHTDGSIGLFLPATGVLFTGDTIANVGGRTRLGVFNLDTERTLQSMHTLASAEPGTALFGHGEPISTGAAAALKAADTEAPTA